MFLNLFSVVYPVDELHKAKEWYGRALQTSPEIVDPAYVGFKIGSNRLELRLTSDTSSDPDQGPVAYWGTSDIENEFERLIGLGAVKDQGIQNIGDGMVKATVADPFGNILGIVGYSRIPDNTAIDGKPSRTALWTTHMRAIAAREPHEEIRGRDHLAEIFLDQAVREGLVDAESRERQKARSFVIGVYEYVMARTRIFDGFFEQAIGQGVEQVVFLGAGYDSRPYRYQQLAKGIELFELDAPPTQEHKRRCLAKAGIEVPANLTYVPVNFNRDPMSDVLHAAGYDTGKKTLFMWEGVTYYLAPEAVDATLAFIASQSPAGSMVAFDYIALWPGIMEAYGVKELIEFNARHQSGESGNHFALEEGAVESFLAQRGLRIANLFNTEDMENSCLTLRDGTLLGHVTASFRILQAVTV